MLRKIITFFVTVVILALFLIPGLLLPQNSSTAAIGENSLVATLEEKPVAAEPCSIILYVGSPESIVNGKQIPIDSNPAVVPFIENSRTLMPLAFVARNMGFEVEWQEAKRTVLLNQQGLTLEFKLGSPIMINNGTAMEMETTARSYNDRTLAPISYVAKAMNLYVTYDRGLIILDSEKEYSLSADKEYIDSLISRLSGLPIVGSADKFNVLMKEIAEEQHDIVLYTEDVVAIETEAAGTDMPVPVPTMQPIVDNSVRESAQSNISKTDLFFGEGGDDIADYSTTNIQVAGVDEADIIKSDGNHIYHLTDNKFIITQADAKGNMKQLCVMDLQNKQAKWQDGFYPQEMYVADDRLCIIGTEHIYQEEEKYRFYGRSYVKALIYDISDKTNPQLIKEFSAEGDLQSSRKVDNILYLIVNYNMYFYGLDAPCDAVPLYRDSAASESELMPLNFGVMRYFPGSESNSILMICGLDIKDAQATANISSILGSGGAVYMSRSALYIAKYNYFYNIVPLDDKVNVDISDKTTFFKFVLDNGNAIYQGKGMALGTVLNQYSMDEFNGSFRAAMTINSGNGESKNALVVFDQSMQQIGSIDNMAPGERIYSARFMGERAFMVTYRTVDPLFALDLSDPRQPRVLGELKIPGYSTYLHPYDENHLIGFGRDTEELTTIDSKGNIVSTRAVNRGLKLALFDISDLMAPQEVAVISIGDESTHSELLYNPKALLFSKEKGFIAFPVSHFGNQKDDLNGAHVYNISPSGITLRGVIKQNQLGINDKLYYDANIQRILYIGETFYSASNLGLQSNDMSSLKYIDFLKYNK